MKFARTDIPVSSSTLATNIQVTVDRRCSAVSAKEENFHAVTIFYHILYPVVRRQLLAWWTKMGPSLPRICRECSRDKITTLRSIIRYDVVGETGLCPADVMKSAFCNL